MTSTLVSCIYKGSVRHRRFTPSRHDFTYPLHMAMFDLDELEQLQRDLWYFSVNRFNFISFHCADYFKQPKANTAAELKSNIIKTVTSWCDDNKQPIPDIQRVCIFTQPRYMGIVFNPLTMYYCYDSENALVAMVADVSNTPWNERYHYVLSLTAEQKKAAQGQQKLRFQEQKAFHVSPFNPMEMTYQWVLRQPGEQLSLHIENHIEGEQTSKHFDATLSMQRQPIKALATLALKMPVMTLQVMWGIYWQAFKLWRKKVPIYDHPGGIRPTKNTPDDADRAVKNQRIG